MNLNLNLQAKILVVLAYTHQFDYPLTAVEIFERLYILPEDKFRFNRVGVGAALKKLKQKKLVKEDGDFFSLATASSKTFETRAFREKMSRLKRQELLWLLRVVKIIPWIKAAVTTGSLAMSNVSKDDDSDFLLITDAQRLWLSRLFIILLAWLKGKRRSWQAEEKNSWCFNMWMTTETLDIPRSVHNIYTAYEVCQAKFIFDDQNLSHQFLIKNSWVKRVLPEYFDEESARHSQYLLVGNGSQIRSVLEVVDAVFSPLISVLNFGAYVFQRLYMWPHQTIETVSYQKAFFHPRSTRSIITKKWRESLLELEKSL